MIVRLDNEEIVEIVKGHFAGLGFEIDSCEVYTDEDEGTYCEVQMQLAQLLPYPPKAVPQGETPKG